jgi:RNA recognition motif-containing protein
VGTRLYVANLPDPASADALRAHFAVCGAVSDVRVLAEGSRGRERATAIVTMSTEEGATRALAELSRRPFGGRILLLDPAPDEAREKRGSKNVDEPQSALARVTVQFREAANMTYELDCSGVRLVLRIFFPTTGEQWRIVARAGSTEHAPSTSSSAPSRLEALRNLASACQEGEAAAAFGSIDWKAVEKAMTQVRAV